MRDAMRRLLVVPAALVVMHAAACAGERDVEPPADTAVPATAPVAPTEAARPGIRFDPATTRAGDRIGVLVLDSIQARPTIVDSTHVGVARFRGSLELTGRSMEHPDADLRDVEVCFEADAASAARIPRWLHDERRAWFCFTNGADAEKALARQGEVTIVIDQFTINRGLTDAVNSARFVR
jgi:hypothetical protein